MSAAHQAPHHVRAHSPQTDHSQLHAKNLSFAARPPDVRKASAFPIKVFLIPYSSFLRGCASKERGIPKGLGDGKAKPYRTSGGEAAMLTAAASFRNPSSTSAPR